jgi:hypothetical protein
VFRSVAKSGRKQAGAHGQEDRGTLLSSPLTTSLSRAPTHRNNQTNNDSGRYNYCRPEQAKFDEAYPRLA